MKTIDEIQRAVVRCRRCPELREYIAKIAAEKKLAHRDEVYWGKPVPSFGDPQARLILVGLAPGAHGSNRTGRPFTGDASGDFLYPALYRAGFASAPVAVSRDDGLRLFDCFITAAARCAPPQNKPTPRELENCFPYLVEEFAALPMLEVVVGLGAIGSRAALRALRERGFALDPRTPQFAHGAEVVARNGERAIVVISSYHPSRQNTNTGKLTVPMFDAIFSRANELLERVPPNAGAGRRAGAPARGREHPSSGRARRSSSETR